MAGNLNTRKTNAMNKLILALIISGTSLASLEARQPNVILIYTDDQGTIDVIVLAQKTSRLLIWTRSPNVVSSLPSFIQRLRSALRRVRLS